LTELSTWAPVRSASTRQASLKLTERRSTLLVNFAPCKQAPSKFTRRQLPPETVIRLPLIL
jgi:hypothetical protein